MTPNELLACLRKEVRKDKSVGYTQKYVSTPKGKVTKRRNHRRWHLKHHYGLTVVEHKTLVEQQHNMCALCGVDFDTCIKGPQVDHSHKTNKVRAILCSMCNHGLGCFRDDIKLVQKALLYLLKHKDA